MNYSDLDDGQPVTVEATDRELRLQNARFRRINRPHSTMDNPEIWADFPSANFGTLGEAANSEEDIPVTITSDTGDTYETEVSVKELEIGEGSVKFHVQPNG